MTRAVYVRSSKGIFKSKRAYWRDFFTNTGTAPSFTVYLHVPTNCSKLFLFEQEF